MSKVSGTYQKVQKSRNSHTDDIYSNCIRSYLEENRALKGKIQSLQSEIKQQRQVNSQLTDELASTQRDTMGSIQKFQEIQQQNEELKRANEELLKEANSKISEINQELQESRREVVELKQEIAQLKNTNQQMILAHEDYAARLDQSQLELRRAKEELNSSKSHVDRLAHENANKEAKITELNATCSSYDQKIRSLSHQIAFNDDRYNEQATLISNLKQRISYLENLQSGMNPDSQLEPLRIALQKSEERCQTLTDALNHSQSTPITDKEIQTLRDEHAVLLKRAEDAEECARQYEKELAEKSQQYIETLNHQNESITSLTEKLREMQEEKDKYQSLAQSFELQYNDLEQRVDVISSRVSSLSMTQNTPKRVSFPDSEIKLSPVQDQ